MRIIVVEDSPDLREVLCKRLESEGFDVAAICTNGEQALDLLLAGEKFDCICSDWQMPVMDGLSLLKAVRTKLNLSVPFVVFSGEHDLSIMKAAGATACFSKPDARELIEFLHGVNHGRT